MRKKPPASPCRTFNAEQRAELEQQLQAQGACEPVSQVDLEKLRARRLKAKAGGDT